jgi:transcriptional regulator with XRE-family HTH domain
MFGEKVKAVCYKLFLNQEDMARELGVSFSTVNRWERGHHNKPVFKAQAAFDKLCKKHGIILEEEKNNEH